MRLGLLALFLISFLITSILHYAEARDHDYGIAISKSCYNIHKFNPINHSSNCPTYESIMAVYPDSSNRLVSGDFDYKDNQLQRMPTKYNNHYELYLYSEKSTMWIDPPGDIRDRINMIQIESSLPIYKLEGETLINETIVHGQYVHIKKCRIATIDSSKWLEVTGLVIQFMKNDCEGDSYINDKKIMDYKKTIFDITTTNKWLHEAWLKHVTENCIFKYQAC